MNEELTIAIEQLRLRTADRAWFIPVMVSDCEVPDKDIGAGETLRDIQWLELWKDWDSGVVKLLEILRSQSKSYDHPDSTAHEAGISNSSDSSSGASVRPAEDLRQKLIGLAASILLASVVALSSWIFFLRQQAEEFSAPQLNVALAEVIEPPGGTRGEDTRAPLVFPADVDQVAVILTLSDERTFPDYRLSMRDSNDERVWGATGLKRWPDGTFSFSLSRGFLPAGEYRVRLYGLDGGREEMLAEYPMPVEYE